MLFLMIEDSYSRIGGEGTGRDCLPLITYLSGRFLYCDPWCSSTLIRSKAMNRERYADRYPVVGPL
ncbi:hypothetical protein F4824DRAFT_443621 [Ustulina deusta]|nr:hypothetical protein F4824DRAFT_443621 [Ustulina deusta]